MKKNKRKPTIQKAEYTFASFTPNMQKDDLWLCFKLLFSTPKQTREKLRRELETQFNGQAFLTDSARTSLYRILKAYNFPQKSEIIVQSLTCSVVSNAIIQADYTPIYADINPKTYNPDPDQIAKLITKKTRAIIVQHTFGIPTNIKRIKELCEQNDIILIEDLAIGLGATSNDKPVGTFGDSAIISFSAAKVISSSRGGAIISHNPMLTRTLSQQNTQQFPTRETYKHILKPIIFAIGKKWYGSFGKALLFGAKKLKLTPQLTTTQEKQAAAPITMYEFSKKLSAIAYNQWLKITQFFKHRTTIAHVYQKYFPTTFPQGTQLLVYPIQVQNTETRQTIITELKNNKIYLDNWYQTAIAPADSDAKACGYTTNSCPNTEAVTQKLLVLPLSQNISVSQAHTIARLIKQHAS